MGEAEGRAPWNATGHVVHRQGKPPPDEHNIFKTFLRASFYLPSPNGQVQQQNSSTYKTWEFHKWRLQHLDLIWGVNTTWVVAMWVGRVGEGGKVTKVKAINRFCHKLPYISLSVISLLQRYKTDINTSVGCYINIISVNEITVFKCKFKLNP